MLILITIAFLKENDKTSASILTESAIKKQIIEILNAHAVTQQMPFDKSFNPPRYLIKALFEVWFLTLSHFQVWLTCVPVIFCLLPVLYPNFKLEIACIIHSLIPSFGENSKSKIESCGFLRQISQLVREGFIHSEMVSRFILNHSIKRVDRVREC